MSFDKQAPTWSAPGVEPPESKKQEGWQVNDKPPAAWLNWFMSLTAESLKELQQKAAEKSDITTINSEIEGLKQSGVDGKNRLETAIIAKEGTVSKQGQVATFEELDNGIHSIPTGTDTSDATAAAGDIISGKIAYGPSGKITGTIPDRGAGGTVTPGATDQTKAAGRYTTAITIKGVPVPAANVLAGTTIAGTSGTMPNRSSENEHMPGSASTVWPGDRFFIQPPNGYYNGTTWVTALVPGLTPANLRNGVNVAGMIGTLIEGKRSASGTATSTSGFDSGYIKFDAPTNYWRNSHYVEVSGMGFVPSVIIVKGGVGGQVTNFIIYYRDLNINNVPNANIILGSLSSGYQPTDTFVFLSTGNAYASASGFRVPVSTQGSPYTWIAIE
ncbi:hypothetical protein [Paenibacillus lautus]|uniref:hypothetical protein n=1 Tax=Paenibacillus lautus TaxID=1401 RepID=UPI0039869CA9